MDKNALRAMLEEGAFPLWALRQYQAATGKGDRAALEFIIERWALLEPSAEAYGVTLNQFQRERELEKVSPIENKRRTARAGGAEG